MAVETPISIQGPEGLIEAIYTEPKQVRDGHIAVICHPHPLFEGTMHNKVVNTLVRVFRELGIAAIRFNFRGVGNSKGTYAEGIGEVEDLMAVIESAKKQYSFKHLWLAGFSFGTFVAAQGSKRLNDANEAPNHLVLAAPAVENFDFDGLFPQQQRTTVLIPTEDDVVDPDAQFKWLDQQFPALDLLEFEGTSHFFHGKLVELRDRLIQVLKEDHPAMLN